VYKCNTAGARKNARGGTGHTTCDARTPRRRRRPYGRRWAIFTQCARTPRINNGVYLFIYLFIFFCSTLIDTPWSISYERRTTIKRPLLTDHSPTWVTAFGRQRLAAAVYLERRVRARVTMQNVIERRWAGRRRRRCGRRARVFTRPSVLLGRTVRQYLVRAPPVTVVSSWTERTVSPNKHERKKHVRVDDRRVLLFAGRGSRRRTDAETARDRRRERRRRRLAVSRRDRERRPVLLRRRRRVFVHRFRRHGRRREEPARSEYAFSFSTRARLGSRLYSYLAIATQDPCRSVLRASRSPI